MRLPSGPLLGAIGEGSQKASRFGYVFVISLEGFGLFIIVVIIVISRIVVDSIWSFVFGKGGQRNIVDVDKPVAQWFHGR